ncbi:MAG: ASCH domain-containing protein [Patescibacteria group bacterium]|nr:ASCH domain-containing protein [Patescibacteria group bacterium]
MHHVAIMRPSWRLIPKIVAGEKTIESRWYLTRRTPWGMVRAGDTVYFKDSGRPVTARARVAAVEQHADLTPSRVRALLAAHGRAIGIAPADTKIFHARLKDKRFCVLIHLKDASTVAPFEIDKTGFGNACAWLTMSDIDRMRVNDAGVARRMKSNRFETKNAHGAFRRKGRGAAVTRSGVRQ